MKVYHVAPAFEDARGAIADILEDEIVEHVSILTTRKGSVRGNHLHRETHQWLYITTGMLRFVTQTEGAESAMVVGRPGDVILTGPSEAHAMEALEDTTMIVMTRGPRGGREYESDTYRLESPLIAPDEASGAPIRSKKESAGTRSR